MARIRCPGCGKTEEVDFYGRFLTTCDVCGKQFLSCIIGQRMANGIDIICPRCGSSQQFALGGFGISSIRVTCSLCGHNFDLSALPDKL